MNLPKPTCLPIRVHDQSTYGPSPPSSFTVVEGGGPATDTSGNKRRRRLLLQASRRQSSSNLLPDFPLAQTTNKSARQPKTLNS
ncbi:hypothetical protein L2E82_39175 [Cichorium intybus]|uniref:Uncharacterized protein n=1 Tax=Cichorium intybus TaxID=13427 RepID=A0ACB9AJ83_CICIN|nr:hypothetical protein L2E82_39175 [Cichorium intybus]